jgi:hypothetical protein
MTLLPMVNVSTRASGSAEGGRIGGRGGERGPAGARTVSYCCRMLNASVIFSGTPMSSKACGSAAASTNVACSSGS